MYLETCSLRLARRFLAAALILAWLLCAAAQAAETSAPSKFRDAEDGWFDASNFLDSAQGFLPLAMPITEPAVGYGAAGAVMFIDRNVSGQEGGFTRPNMTMVGGLRTENGTQGLFATHMGTWYEDRIRTIVALADMDVNLDYFGLGGGRNPADTGVGYSISARGGLLGGSFRLGTTPFWSGLRYTRVQTGVSLLGANPGLPGILPGDTTEERIAALTPSLTLDTRDNFFTPTRGWYFDASALLARESVGSDRSFERLGLNVIHYRPVSRDLFLGVRASARSSSDNTPFFLRPYVGLRGVQAMRYQGEDAGEVEAELRWQVHPRFSVVGFGGVGTARGSGGALDRERSVKAGGAGVRYLLARKHGLHMGLDVAAGPDKPAIYLVLGSAWVRP
jgi:hypothetical protein